MPPAEGEVVLRFVQDAQRRVRTRMLFEGAAIGLGVAAVCALIGWPVRGAGGDAVLLGATLAMVGAVSRRLVSRVSLADAARLVESRASECHNLLITAFELATTPRGGYVDAVVQGRAAALTSSLSLPQVLPLRRQLIGATTALLLWAVAVATRSDPLRHAIADAVGSDGTPTLTSLVVEVVPPAYSGRPIERATDPARVTMLAGSRLRVTGSARAEGVLITTMTDEVLVPVQRDGAFAASPEVAADGFLALTPVRGDSALGARRLIGISVVADEAPTVRITRPGRDLGVPDGNRSIAVSIEARDDIGLASLILRAVTVSGAGERFSFRERDIPVALERIDRTHWRASASLALAPLGLEQGDMVVYRAIASDARPGAPAVESDAWIVEVLSPGSIAAEGFAIDPEQDRYALSQQMVILKTERLLAKRATLSVEAYADSAAELAAEQRRVRSEFVFMMGGEIEDEHGHEGDPNQLNEVAEAEAEDELLAGRLQNSGRIAILRGIRFMSRADLLLNTANVAEALVAERRALAEIEKAFARSRIILRALSQREQLDLTRRLTGVRDGAAGGNEAVVRAGRDQAHDAMRRLLTEMALLRGDGGSSAARSARASALAEASLRLGPGDAAFQAIARLLTATSTSLAAGRPTEGATLLDSASVALSRIVTGSPPRAARRNAGLEASQLRGGVSNAGRTP